IVRIKVAAQRYAEKSDVVGNHVLAQRGPQLGVNRAGDALTAAQKENDMLAILFAVEELDGFGQRIAKIDGSGRIFVAQLLQSGLQVLAGLETVGQVVMLGVEGPQGNAVVIA